MPSSKPARRLADIVEQAERISGYIQGLDQETFRADAKTVDAVERCLQRLSEAASKLGNVGPELIPKQDWAGIRGLGNRLRHEYDQISLEQLWEIASRDTPALAEDCRQALARLND